MIPSGISLVVNSSSAKLDMEALTASIPKYKCLEEMYKAWWLSFLEQLNGSFNAESIEEKETWTLYAWLKSIYLLLPSNITKFQSISDIPEEVEVKC